MNPSSGIASFKYVDFPNIDIEIQFLFLKYNSILFSKDSSLLLALYPIRKGNKQFFIWFSKFDFMAQYFLFLPPSLESFGYL